MKKLILTEKPSVAWDFAKTLQFHHRHPDHFETSDYLITWTIGHLLELYEPHDYNPLWKKWSFQNLPIFPEKILYRPIERTKHHLQQLLRLLKRKDISQIIVATDAGREGELIARLVLKYAKVPANRPIFRFWTALALTPEVIQKTLTQLRPWQEFDHLYEAGIGRQISDWLVGMNFSRAATLKLGDLFSVGRVQTAVLSFLVERKHERENFKSRTFWILQAQFLNPKGNWKGTWFNPQIKENPHHLHSKAEAEKLKGHLLSFQSAGKIFSLKKTAKDIPPPLLFSLTELQREANKEYGFSAQRTLDLAQKLYEKWKCLSYPRTNSRKLGSENFSLVKKLVENFSSQWPSLFSGIETSKLSPQNTHIFDDTKIQDHHALIPLKNLPTGATEEERKVFDLVLKRFASIFWPHCSTLVTEVVTLYAQNQFKTKGTVVLNAGWTLVYSSKSSNSNSSGQAESMATPSTSTQQIIPPLEKEDEVFLKRTHIQEGQTIPPPEYTENTLLADMENPSRKVEEKDLKALFRGEVGLGTESTRAQIIETLLQRGYVVRERRQLLATIKGVQLVQFLRHLPQAKTLTTPEETARWEMQLQKIGQGQEKRDQFLTQMKEFISKSIKEFQTLYPPSPIQSPPLSGPATQILVNKNSSTSFPIGQVEPLKKDISLGPCPTCGKKVLELAYSFECSGKKEKLCTFSIKKWLGGQNLTALAIDHLLKKGISPLIKGIKGKSGKSFNAYLKLTILKNGEVGTTFQFPALKKSKKNFSSISKHARTNKNRPIKKVKVLKQDFTIHDS